MFRIEYMHEHEASDGSITNIASKLKRKMLNYRSMVHVHKYITFFLTLERNINIVTCIFFDQFISRFFRFQNNVN